MSMDNNTVLTIEHAETIYKRNFGGQPDSFNPNGGKRYFNVIVPEDLVEPLINDGWHVKETHPRDDQAVQHYLKVNVNFDGFRPPKIWVKTEGHKGDPILLDAETVGEMDSYEIANMTVNITPWITKKYSTVPAYLKSAYVTIKENDFVPEGFFDNDSNNEDTPF